MVLHMVRIFLHASFVIVIITFHNIRLIYPTKRIKMQDTSQLIENELSKHTLNNNDEQGDEPFIIIRHYFYM